MAAEPQRQQQHRELSGVFADAAKFEECWEQLRSPDCCTASVRIYHNTAEQLVGTAQALLLNRSASQLEIGVVPDADAAEALAALLKDTSSIHTLVIQELRGCADVSPASGGASAATTSAAPAAAEPVPSSIVFQGLAANRSITSLTLHRLQPAEVLQLAAALAAQGAGAGRLQQLHLPGVRFEAAAAAALSAALCSSQPHLTQLGLTGASFVSACPVASAHSSLQLPQGQQQQDCAACTMSCLFSAELAGHQSLAEVSLQGSTALCWEALGCFVAQSKQLRQLVLSEAGLGTDGAQQLGRSLSRAAAAAADAMVPGAHGACSVSSLDHCGSSSSSSSSSWGSGLRVLDLSGNGIGSQGAGALGQGLSTACPALQTLKLSSCSLGAEGVSALVEGLLVGAAAAAVSGRHAHQSAGVEQLPGALRELVLSENGITDALGVQALLAHPFGQGLTHLSLANNCLDDSAAKQLTAALSNSTSSLRVLNLSHNWVKDEGSTALAGLLQHPSSCALSTLLLHHNRMSRAGVERLAETAIGNRRVQEVQLHGNRVLGSRLQVLEDLQLVLANRRHKAQQQQPEEQQQKEQQDQHPAARACSASTAPSTPFALVPSASAATAAAATGADAMLQGATSSAGASPVHDAAAHISLAGSLMTDVDSKAATAAGGAAASSPAPARSGELLVLPRLQLPPSLAGPLLQRRQQQQLGVWQASEFSFDHFLEELQPQAEAHVGPPDTVAQAAAGGSAGVGSADSVFWQAAGCSYVCVGDPVQQPASHNARDTAAGGADAECQGRQPGCEGRQLASDLLGPSRLPGCVSEGSSRVSSLSGWVSDAAFSEAGQSLPGIRRRYMFVHGQQSGGSSSGSGSGGGSVSGSGGSGCACTLQPFGGGGGTDEAAGMDCGGDVQGWVVLRSAGVGEGSGGRLRLQPARAAASLLFGRTRSSSSSSSSGGVGGSGGGSPAVSSSREGGACGAPSRLGVTTAQP